MRDTGPSSCRPARRGRGGSTPRRQWATPGLRRPRRKFSRIAIVNRGEPAMRFINAVARVQRRARHGRCAPSRCTPTRTARPCSCARPTRAYDLGPATFTDEPGRRRLRYLDYETLERGAPAPPAPTRSGSAGASSPSTPPSPTCASRLGIVFIGPDADVMRRLGDKITSKQIAESGRRPRRTLERRPGRNRRRSSRRTPTGSATRVMIKATAGGGGRGIRRVYGPPTSSRRRSTQRAPRRSAPSATTPCSSSDW